MIPSVLLLTIFIRVGFSYNILAVYPVHVKSHYAVIDPLIMRLVELGHHVTIYNSFPKKQAIPNYNEVDISDCFNPRRVYSMDIETRKSGAAAPYNHIMWLFTITKTIYTIESFENCPPLKALMNSTEKYDLLITESFVSDVMQLFANKFGVPTVTCISNMLLPWLSDRMGNPANPSYIPHILSGYVSTMTFTQRFQNAFLYVVSIVGHNKMILENEEKIVEHYLGSAAPSLFNIVRNTSIMFINAHYSLNPIIPLVSAVVPIGGIHIKQPGPLSKVCYLLKLIIVRKMKLCHI